MVRVRANRSIAVVLLALAALPVFCVTGCSSDGEAAPSPRASVPPTHDGSSSGTPTSPPTSPSTTPPPPVGDGGAPDATSDAAPKPPPPPGAPGCGLPSAAFCDTFDAPAGIGNRSGDLNGTIWGVSRITGGINFGGLFNATPATTLQTCNGPATVRPPNDIIICNGQLREATNDNPSGQCEAGGVTVLAMYPKQPFDFQGRTGKIVFDVADDSHGTHAAWPELWVTDKPVPAPFAHFATWIGLPKFGFGLRFAGCPKGGPGIGVDSAIIINDYTPVDTANGGKLDLEGLDCVTTSTGPGNMIHFEVQVSQGQLDVYATEPGTTAPLKHLSTLKNANLGFSRGLVWLEDVHYNADKGETPACGPGSQKQHTFVWDNFGFDGPFTYRDLAFDAPDNDAPNSDGTINLAKMSAPNGAATWSVPGKPASPTAESVRVLFNFYHYDAPSVLNVTVNGHTHATPWPYPETQGYTWRTLAVDIPITDLVAGTNQVTIGATDQAIATSNVDIVLANVTQ